jgi:cation diffusion facilitator family transporter
MKQPLATVNLKHSHRFDEGNPLAEKSTLRVAVLTAVMMVIEIFGGWYYNSMALLADGWHMSSHTIALGLSVFAYVYARKYAHDPQFSFGTWKIEVLGGYTSAIFLVMVAGLMVYQSVGRLISPSPIHYDQAIVIAIVGLLVNLASAWLLKDGHHHDHGHHDHVHSHDGHGHHDLNLRSAYMHVLADAATSVLAIIALFGGKIWGASWLDPLMGLVGAVMVSVVDEIREAIAASPIKAQLNDLHVWRVGKGKFACILSLATDNEVSPEYFKEQLSIHEELVHISIEINRFGAQ